MDIERLLKLLKENKADFVIIGATAFPVYGYSRATLDLDIFIRPTKENVKRVMQGLEEFGYDIADLSIKDFLEKKILIRQYILEIDVHPFVAGVEFEDVWKTKVKNKIGDVEVYFASLDNLIKMKKSAGRAKDIEDLKYLEKIKEKTKTTNSE
jgi:predicted nucleotidyltransferase